MKLSQLLRVAAKKLKYTDSWVEQILKHPMNTIHSFHEVTDMLIAAAKERGLSVTSVTPRLEVMSLLRQYLEGKGKKLASSATKLASSNKKFDQYIALAADDVKSLRKSDVYRVLNEAKSAKELSALAAYIIEKNATLRATVTDDVNDVKEEKGWA